MGKDPLIRELKKMQAPKFDGTGGGDAAEAWLIGINKYFGLSELNSNTKARIAIYQLEGEASLWWDHLAEIKNYDISQLTWEKFTKWFRKEYLFAHH
ncbi:hypothetical protein SUGI_0633870 [Cryptomeria japonica]|nr:hypothetical protein SUGI_0633870 [Cryptomeria japonica]